MSIAFQTGQIDFPGMLNTYSATDIIMARIHDFENMLHSIMELEERTGEPLFFPNKITYFVFQFFFSLNETCSRQY